MVREKCGTYLVEVEDIQLVLDELSLRAEEIPLDVARAPALPRSHDVVLTPLDSGTLRTRPVGRLSQRDGRESRLERQLRAWRRRFLRLLLRLLRANQCDLQAARLSLRLLLRVALLFNYLVDRR